MKKLQVFDPALCCSTGVCGAEVDQALVDFSADVDWLKQAGGQIGSRVNDSEAGRSVRFFVNLLDIE